MKLFRRRDKIGAFWDWFAKNSVRLLSVASLEDKSYLELNIKAAEMNNNIVCVLGPVNSQPRQLIVSADGKAEAFETVKKIVENAPKLPEWEIIAFRPPVAPKTIPFGDGELRPEDVWFSLVGFEGKASVKLYIRGFRKNNKLLSAASMLMIESILGEYDFENLIGYVEWLDLPDNPAGKGLLPIDVFFDAVKKVTAT